MEVSTSFQWVTRAEQAFFEKELDCLEATITGGMVDCTGSEQAFKTAYDASLRGNLLILISAVLGLLLFFLLVPQRGCPGGGPGPRAVRRAAGGSSLGAGP